MQKFTVFAFGMVLGALFGRSLERLYGPKVVRINLGDTPPEQWQVVARAELERLGLIERGGGDGH